VNCAPTNKNQVYVIKNEYKLLPNNGYHFVYELSDGQSRDELGTFEEVDGKLILRVIGRYTFYGSNNKFYTVDYTADENGEKLFF
jgi:hypothetical protein